MLCLSVNNYILSTLNDFETDNLMINYTSRGKIGAVNMGLMIGMFFSLLLSYSTFFFFFFLSFFSSFFSSFFFHVIGRAVCWGRVYVGQ